MKKILSALALAAIVTASVAQAAPPVQNISPYRHGNLAAAQSLSVQAFDRLTAAQVADHYDLGGHIGRAKDLLRRANIEIKLAAVYANHH